MSGTTNVDERLYLVTAASGHTGREVVQQLRSQQLRVRALVFHLDKRSDALKQLDAEVVQADLNNLDQVRAALRGVYSAYFVYPIRPGLVNATAVFAQAAEESGIKAIVNMSQISARGDSLSHAAQTHWLAERVFEKFATPVTHLRPTFFSEWFLYTAPLIKAKHRLELPIRKGHHAPISAHDQARVIVAILQSPDAHASKIYPLYGVKEYTYEEMCAILSDVVGYKVTYAVCSKEDAANYFLSRSNSDFLVQHLMAVFDDYENGVFSGTNDVVERVSGTPPQPLHDFFVQHKDQF